MIDSKRLRYQSIRLGLVSSITGCALFVLVEQLRLTIKFGYSGKTDIEFAILLFVVGVIFVTIPTIIASSVLAMFLHNQAGKNKLTLYNAFQAGAAIGVTTCVGISILGALLVSVRGSFAVFMLHIVEVAIISFICGGWTGKKLADYIIQEFKYTTA
jgi:flagellar biosynthesis protein FliQ